VSVHVLDPSALARYASLAHERDRERILNPPAGRRIVAVGAAPLGEPVALALAELFPSRYAEVLSLYVSPGWRASGLGTRLLARLEEELVARECALADLYYSTGTPTTGALEAALRRRGFGESERRMLVCTFEAERVLSAPWLARQVVPRGGGFEVFPWAELPPRDRETIVVRQARNPWFPRDLDPFAREATMDAATSLGLRYRGEVAGWVITHRIAPDTLRYTSGFVRADLQRMARMIALGRLAMQRQVLTGVPLGTWAVSLARPRMLAFVRERLRPFLRRTVETRRARKVFDPSGIQPTHTGTASGFAGTARGFTAEGVNDHEHQSES
jgi:GNAT superfamily N-acetyltransferase